MSINEFLLHYMCMKLLTEHEVNIKSFRCILVNYAEYVIVQFHQKFRSSVSLVLL
jgi:hypothetical protein